MIKWKAVATSAHHEALGQFGSNPINRMNKDYLFSKRQFSNQIQFEAKNHCGIEKCTGPSPKKTWLCKCYMVKVKTNDDFCKYSYCRIRNITKQGQELIQQKLIVFQLRHTRHVNAAVEILHCFKLTSWKTSRCKHSSLYLSLSNIYWG